VKSDQTRSREVSAPDDLPILPRSARRRDGRSTHLRSPLRVDPSRRLLRVRRPRQADVGELGSQVSVVALVDDERVLWDRLGVDLVGVEQIDKLGLSLGRSD
jgi:hypothetical protein